MPAPSIPEDTAETQQGDTAGVTTPADGDTDLLGTPVPAVRRPIADDPTDRRRKLLDKAVTEWVRANPKAPTKSAVAQRFAEYMVATEGADRIRMVMGWVGDHIGTPGLTSKEWVAWKLSVEPKDAITVAWLLTVAADLVGARFQEPGSSSFEATRERVVQVLDEAALQELGMTGQEQGR